MPLLVFVGPLFILCLSRGFLLVLLQAMQMAMETFCGLAVLLLACGGGMALEAPMQVFAGIAVCLLALAVAALWTVV